MEESPDPWGISNGEGNETLDDGFKDNFVSEEDADKLPDHHEYLNKLETKLGKLTKKNSIAKELAARRSDDARRMLESNAAALELFDDEELDENSMISRRLFPEKQALTMSEIAKLLESDTLAKTFGEENEEKPNDAKEVNEEKVEK